MGDLENRHHYGTQAYWKARADETRAMADNLTDPDARRQMLDIAEWYEQMATKTPPGEATTFPPRKDNF